MIRFSVSILGLCLAAANANGALLGRSPLTPGGTDYRAYYDTVLNITWLADANYAATNTFGVPGIGGIYPAGAMTWDTAQAWIAAMNAANHLGFSNWRQPTVTDTGPPGCDFAFDGTDCGWNMDLTTGEITHLFYSTLGNDGGYDTGGILQPCYTSPPQYCLSNPGPFSNVALYYFYGTPYVLNTLLVWGFSLATGSQYVPAKDNHYSVWAVHPGDIDSDTDGVQDFADNCTLVANANQRDTNGDGYGNLCDPDFNGDGTVNINDFNRLKARLNISPVVDIDTDLDGNGAVNINDFNRLKSFLGKPPGPSGQHPNCPPTCP
jgi:Dockerin type I domain/Thrombospondin type 3 repeat